MPLTHWTDIEVRFQSELDWRASEIDDLRGLIAKYDKETKEVFISYSYYNSLLIGDIQLQTSLQTVQGQLEVSQRDGLVSNETAQEYSKTVHNLQQELALWKTKKPEVVVQKPILVSSGMQSDPIPVVKPEWEVVDIPTQTDRVPLLNSFVQTDALVEKAVPLTSSVECQTECLTADDSFDAVLQDFEHQLEVKKEIGNYASFCF